MELRDHLANVVAYAEDDYLRLNGTLGGSALFVADRIIEYLESKAPEPVYEYAVPYKSAYDPYGNADVWTAPLEYARETVKDSEGRRILVRRIVSPWEEVEE